jgi:hypothetical protein
MLSIHQILQYLITNIFIAFAIHSNFPFKFIKLINFIK